MASWRRPRRREGERRAAVALRAIPLAACLLAGAPADAQDRDKDKDRPPATEIVVKRAARECFTSLIHGSGYLVPRSTAVVTFAVPGYRITEVRAKVGDIVKHGDIVVRAAPADPPPVAPTDKAAASAIVDVTSPASGLVLRSTAFAGMLTSQAPKPLFTLAVDGEIEAEVEVPSVHILELQTGQPAHLKMGDGSVLDAHVRRTPVTVDRASQMGAARLSIDAGERLEPTRFVRATIEARRSCGIGVPMTALRRSSTGPTVQVVEDGVVVGRPIQLGLANDTDTEVTSGLAEGDLVVASTGSSREGDRVKPVFDMRDAR